MLKTQGIELLSRLMKEVFLGKINKTKLHAEIFRSIGRLYASIMHMPTARIRVLGNDPRDFLTSFTSLLKVNWSMLERLD